MLNIPLLKLANIFGGMNQSPSPTTPNVGVLNQNVINNTDPSQDIMSQIAQLLQPREDQFNALTAQANNPPQREQYQPDAMRKISAFMAGLGGTSPNAVVGGQPVGLQSDPLRSMAASRAVLDEPFNKAVENYKLRLEPLEKTAQLEGQRNTNDRLIGSQMITAEKNANTLKLNQDKFEQKSALDQAKLEDQKRKTDAYIKAQKFKEDHSDYESFTDENDEIVFIDKNHPEVKPVKTGLKSNELSDLEKINLQHRGRMQEISARGNETRKTNESKSDTDEKGWSVQDNYDPETGKWIGKIRVNSITGESAPVKGALGPKAPPKDKDLLPTQQKQALVNKAQQVLSQHPDLRRYIVFDTTTGGTVTGVHVADDKYLGIYATEASKAKRNEAYNLLFGESNDNTKSTQAVIKPTVRADGKTHVKIKGTSETGWVTNPDMTKYEYIP